MINELNDWARRHAVSPTAFNELMVIVSNVLTTDSRNDTAPDRNTSEASVQAEVMLAASKRGEYLWRNNVGVAIPEGGGRPVRYGLANDSKRLNEHLKSSDLIGWRTVVITPEHVGQKFAQFMARECKHRNWKFAGTPRELAQLNWISLINNCGGDAAFTTGE